MHIAKEKTLSSESLSAQLCETSARSALNEQSQSNQFGYRLCIAIMETEFYCPRCQTSFTLPESISSEVKQEVLTLVYEKQRILAVKVLMDLRKIGLGNAKTAVWHIPSEPNVCHRCQKPVEANEIVTCPKCKSLNLNWQ